MKRDAMYLNTWGEWGVAYGCSITISQEFAGLIVLGMVITAVASVALLAEWKDKK